MKSILGFVAVAAVSLAAFNCVAGELVILQPTGEDAVWLMSKRKMDYLALPLAERVKKFADAGERGILAAEPNAPTNSRSSPTFSRQEKIRKYSGVRESPSARCMEEA